MQAYPGQIQFTWIPLPAHSLLIALVICSTPPFVAAYGLMLMLAMNEMMLATLMIFPGRLSWRSRRPTSCAATKLALRLMAKT